MSRLITLLKSIGFIIGFSGFVAYEIIKANLRIALDVLTPGLLAKPGVVHFPLSCVSDNQITLLGLLISLTPGTLTLDVNENKKIMLIHVMYLHSEADFIQEIKNNYEQPVQEILS